MGSKVIQVTIKGMPPGILMHRFPVEPIEAPEKKTVEEQAEVAAYRHPETGSLYIPGINLQRSLVAGATYSKGKGRASLQRPAAACLFVNPPYLDLGASKYEIDSRPVVVPATKGRILRHRPWLADWSVRFQIEYDDTLLKETEVREIVDNTGRRVGVLDFRPEKKGPFGRFIVTSWQA